MTNRKRSCEQGLREFEFHKASGSCELEFLSFFLSYDPFLSNHVDFLSPDGIVKPSCRKGDFIWRQQEKSREKEPISVKSAGIISCSTMLPIRSHLAPGAVERNSGKPEPSEKTAVIVLMTAVLFVRLKFVLRARSTHLVRKELPFFLCGLLRGALLLAGRLLRGCTLAGGRLFALLRIVAKQAAEQSAAKA